MTQQNGLLREAGYLAHGFVGFFGDFLLLSQLAFDFFKQVFQGRRSQVQAMLVNKKEIGKCAYSFPSYFGWFSRVVPFLDYEFVLPKLEGNLDEYGVVCLNGNMLSSAKSLGK